jgi:hypothetical protein
LSVQKWGYETNQCATTGSKQRVLTQHCNSPLRRLAPKEKHSRIGELLGRRHGL